MAFDGFLIIDGIKGESPDSSYPGTGVGNMGTALSNFNITLEAQPANCSWIDAKNFTWGVESKATTSTGGGLAAGRAALSELTFDQTIHRGSPTMWGYCCIGKHIKSCVFIARKSIGEAKPVEFLVIGFENCMITKVETSGSGDELPAEKVNITYKKCTISYKHIDSKGNKETAVTVWYDQKEQKSSLA